MFKCEECGKEITKEMVKKYNKDCDYKNISLLYEIGKYVCDCGAKYTFKFHEEIIFHLPKS